jgi:hypothetical protein
MRSTLLESCEWVVQRKIPNGCQEPDARLRRQPSFDRHRPVAGVFSTPAAAGQQQFENIYWTKRKEIKAFYDAGGGDLITLGTHHPSWGEFFTPLSVHRELQSLSRSGIPNAPCFASRRSTAHASAAARDRGGALVRSRSAHDVGGRNAAHRYRLDVESVTA